jgi:hypothetical protein
MARAASRVYQCGEIAGARALPWLTALPSDGMPLAAVGSPQTYGWRRGCHDFPASVCLTQLLSSAATPHLGHAPRQLRTSSCGIPSRWPIRISGIALAPCRVPVVVGHAPPPRPGLSCISARVNLVSSRHACLALVTRQRALACLPSCGRVAQAAGHAACGATLTSAGMQFANLLDKHDGAPLVSRALSLSPWPQEVPTQRRMRVARRPQPARRGRAARVRRMPRRPRDGRRSTYA